MFNSDNNGWFIVLILLLALGGFNGGFGGFGGGRIAFEQPATAQQVYDASNQQTVNSKLDGIVNGICSSSYENARILDSINYGNLQNTNTITTAMNNGFTNVSAQINDLAHQMQSCCCELKTQMLQDKYEDVSRQLEQAQGVIANTVQSQNILGNLGRYVPWGFPTGTTIA